MGKQPESRLSLNIQKHIKANGGWCYKVWGNAMTPKGIPDIVGVYRGLMIAIETKLPEGDNPSTMQRYRMGCIRRMGGFTTVARSLGDVRQFLHHLDLYHVTFDDPPVPEDDECPYRCSLEDEE